MTKLITPKAATALYREITGQSINIRFLTEIALPRFCHLAAWWFDRNSGRRKLVAIHRARFEYFVKQRMVDRGVRNIFERED